MAISASETTRAKARIMNQIFFFPLLPCASQQKRKKIEKGKQKTEHMQVAHAQNTKKYYIDYREEINNILNSSFFY